MCSCIVGIGDVGGLLLPLWSLAALMAKSQVAVSLSRSLGEDRKVCWLEWGYKGGIMGLANWVFC